MLTCKSLFGLGYRGERLIEPSIVLLVVKSRLKGSASGLECCFILVREIVKLRGPPKAQATNLGRKLTGGPG